MITSDFLPEFDALPEYDREAFVNRNSELDFVRERLSALVSASKPVQPILAVWGVPGAGKSWILHHLVAEIAERDRVNEKLPISGMVSCRKFQCEQWTPLLLPLVRQFYGALAHSNLPDAADAAQTFIDFAGRGDLPIEREEIARRFVDVVLKITSQKAPLLMMFDDVDEIEAHHSDYFGWFEEKIIAPIIRQDQVIIVFTSNHELRRWKQFEVRRRIKQIELQPFDRSTCAKQVTGGNAIYYYSGGHPLSTAYIFHQLNPLRATNEEFNVLFLRQHRSLLGDTLKRLQEWLLRKIESPETISHLLIIATLRHFHINSVREYLAQILNEPSLMNRPEIYIHEYITALVSTDLVRWSVAQHNYIVDPSVRRIINRVRELDKPDEYRHYHRVALEMYAGWNSQTADSSGFFIEALYHLAALRVTFSEEESRHYFDLLETKIDSTLKEGRFSPEGAQAIRELFANDSETRDLLGQFVGLIEKRLQAAFGASTRT